MEDTWSKNYIQSLETTVQCMITDLFRIYFDVNPTALLTLLEIIRKASYLDLDQVKDQIIQITTTERCEDLPIDTPTPRDAKGLAFGLISLKFGIDTRNEEKIWSRDKLRAKCKALVDEIVQERINDVYYCSTSGLYKIKKIIPGNLTNVEKGAEKSTIRSRKKQKQKKKSAYELKECKGNR